VHVSLAREKLISRIPLYLSFFKRALYHIKRALYHRALLQTRQDARIVLNLSFFKRALYHIKRVLHQRALYHRALLRTRQDARIPLHFWFFTRALYHVGLFCGSTKEPCEKRPMALYLSVADSTRYTNFFASFFFQKSPISYQNSPVSQCSFADPYDAQISISCTLKQTVFETAAQ